MNESAAGVWIRGGGAVDGGLEIRGEVVDRCVIGTRDTDGRHLARAQLPNDFFPDAGIGSDFG